jgi:hypothetical protein
VNSSVALWKIPTENSVGDSLCNWHDEQCSQFTNKFTDRITDRNYSFCNSVGKNNMSSFFLLCFNFFSHGNSLGIYRGNISVGKIPRKFTDGNIPSVFQFVFINFLVVSLPSIFSLIIQSHFSQIIKQINIAMSLNCESKHQRNLF